jgi:hypothetical protein
MKKIIYAMFIIGVIAIGVVLAADVNIKIITFGKLHAGAKISGKVSDSDRCGEAIIGDFVVKDGPDKGKTVRGAVWNLDKKGLWLGVTAIIDGSEKDFPVELVQGRFSDKEYSVFTISDIAKGEAPPETASIVWVARLWKWKVTAEVCAHLSSDGNACIYCRRNGYHMKESVASDQK